MAKQKQKKNNAVSPAIEQATESPYWNLDHAWVTGVAGVVASVKAACSSLFGHPIKTVVRIKSVNCVFI
jgi:hypothetical protein